VVGCVDAPVALIGSFWISELVFGSGLHRLSVSYTQALEVCAL
jgi:hypothetical protein